MMAIMLLVIAIAAVVLIISRAFRSNGSSSLDVEQDEIGNGAASLKGDSNSSSTENSSTFRNVGQSLKNWAILCRVLGIADAVIIVVISCFKNIEWFLCGVVAGLISLLGAWIFSMILYALGELVVNSRENKKIQQEILNELRNKKQ